MTGLPTWLWWLIATALLLPALGLIAIGFYGDRPRGRRRCPKCWYDMSRTDGLRCPECGRTQRGEHRLHRPRRRSRMITAGALLAVAAGGTVAHLFMRAKPYGWWTCAPTWLLIEAAVRSDDEARWVHLMERLSADKTGTFPTAPFRRNLAFDVSWRRLADGCARIVVDPSHDADTRLSAAAVLGAWIPDRRQIDAALEYVVANSETASTQDLCMVLDRYTKRFQEAPDDLAAIAAQRFMREPVLRRDAGASMRMTLLFNDAANANIIRPMLIACDDCEPWAAAWLREVLDLWVRAGRPEVLRSRLEVIDDLLADPASELDAWHEELARLHELARAAIAWSQVMKKDPRSVVGVEWSDAQELALALDEALRRGTFQDDRPEWVRLKSLVGELAAIHVQEIHDLQTDSAEPWKPLKDDDCDAIADRVTTGTRILLARGALPPDWVQAIIAPGRSRRCFREEQELVTLFARDSTLHTRELQRILDDPYDGSRFQTAILRGVRMGYAPVEQRLAWLDAWIAHADPRDADLLDHLEWNRGFLVAEQNSMDRD